MCVLVLKHTNFAKLYIPPVSYAALLFEDRYAYNILELNPNEFYE